MIDIKILRENPDIIRDSLSKRSIQIDIDSIIELDKKIRHKARISAMKKWQRNNKSKEIGRLKSEGKDCSTLLAETKFISQDIKEIDAEVGGLSDKINELIINIPNIPHNSAPIGKGVEHYRLVKEEGKKPAFSFTPVPHFELAKRLGIIDFEGAARMSGSNFVLFRGIGALLERALVNFMLDLHTREHGYTEVSPPVMVNRKSMTGTGQLPNLEKDMYLCEEDDLFMVPTAEVSLVNMHREEILDGNLLPISYVAYTPCFRREAGSYGKETRGLVRIHQFDKVELVKFSLPEKSYDELERMLLDAEKVIQLLGLPYRIMELPAGEISFASAKTYDIEVWAPAHERYLEVSSVSNCGDFQARRAQIRYRKDGEKGFVHTLNASGVALPRTLVALLENYQNPDGTVAIPEILIPYMGGVNVID